MTDQPLATVMQPMTTPPPARLDVMRDVLAAASTLLVALAFVVPLLKAGTTIDGELKGAIILQWGLVMGYYFGTSKGSVAKDATIAQMSAKAPTQ